MASTYNHSTTTMMCVRVLDYLMERTWLRKIESAVVNNKFYKYDEGTLKMLSCSGNIFGPGCSDYLDMARDQLLQETIDRERATGQQCCCKRTKVGKVDNLNVE